MPYIASNQDVNKQENWNGLLVTAGLVLGAAAVGGAISSSKNISSMKKLYDKDDVVKGLYGRNAKDIYASKKGWANINQRNFQMDGEDFAKSTPRYQAGKSMTGKAKMYRTDGNPLQNMYSNWKDKDLKMFNRELKDLQTGKGSGADSIYAHSKLSLYDNLNVASQTLNTNTNELNKLTKQIYDSKGLSKVRKQAVLEGNADDATITNKVWGDLFGSDEVYNYKERNKVNEKLARQGPPKFDTSRALPENATGMNQTYTPNFELVGKPYRPYNPVVNQTGGYPSQIGYTPQFNPRLALPETATGVSGYYNQNFSIDSKPYTPTSSSTIYQSGASPFLIEHNAN